MRASRHSRTMLMHAAMIAAGVALIAGTTLAAYEQGYQQRGQPQDQYRQQDRQQYGSQTREQPYGQEEYGSYDFNDYDWDRYGQFEERETRLGWYGQQGQQSAQSRQIQRRLAQQLRNRVEGSEGIAALVLDNQVFLFGRVTSEQAKDRVTELAGDATGIDRIENNLTVSEEGWEPQDDATIQNEIRDEFWWSPFLDADQIQISVRNGLVMLSGQVGDFNEMAAAIKNAYEGGARAVRNQLRIGVPGQRMAWERVFDETDRGYYPPYGYAPGREEESEREETDHWQQDRIQRGQLQRRDMTMPQRRLAADLALAQRVALQLQQLSGDQIVHVVDPQAIYVHVFEGIVTLYGSVQNENQKRRAEQSIQNIRGVQDVQNELQVQGPQQQLGWQMGRQQMTASDRQLAQQVERQLQSRLPDANINVMVSQGTVTLQGFVQDQSQKQRAERIARSVPGVEDLQNNLSIGVEGAEYPALGYIPGQEGQAEQQQTGVSGDSECVQMLKQSLTSQNLRDMARHIYVTCQDGKMALSGYVTSDDEKNQLERVSKQIEAIKEVENSLIVREKGWTQKPDAELQEDVESQLWWSPFVDSDEIDVQVRNGTVTLSGQVEDWDAMRAAIKNTFDAGAKRVRSRLRYRDSQGQTRQAEQY